MVRTVGSSPKTPFESDNPPGPNNSDSNVVESVSGSGSASKKIKLHYGTIETDSFVKPVDSSTTRPVSPGQISINTASASSTSDLFSGLTDQLKQLETKDATQQQEILNTSLQALEEHGATLKSEHSGFVTLLPLRLVEYSSLEQLNRLLHSVLQLKNAKPEWSKDETVLWTNYDNELSRALLKAVELDKEEMVKTLIVHDALPCNPKIWDSGAYKFQWQAPSCPSPPLICAVANGRVKMVKILLNEGAPIAVERSTSVLMKLRQTSRAGTSVESNDPCDLLQLAMDNGYEEIVQLLQPDRFESSSLKKEFISSELESELKLSCATCYGSPTEDDDASQNTKSADALP